jgi:hypothetical protein
LCIARPVTNDHGGAGVRSPEQRFTDDPLDGESVPG